MFQLSGGAEAAGGGGLWTLEGDRLVRLADSRAGPATVLVPTEDILVAVVDLPLPTRRQRAAALPFAVEDRLAQPLSETHFALGSELAPRQHLAAAVSHRRMGEWMARLQSAGIGRFMLVPDALTLPTPSDGRWAVQFRKGRALVRLPDGGAFAGPAEFFVAAWEASGRPALMADGDAPPAVPSAEPLDLAPLALRAASPLLDLRQSPYAAQTGPSAVVLRRVAAVAAVGLIAHAGIAVADTLALKRLATERRSEALTLARTVAPGPAASGDLEAVLESLASDQPSAGGRFLGLLSRASVALKPFGADLAARSLSYGPSAGLTLNLEASDLAELQRIQAALTAAGLRPTAGPATSQAGAAVGEFVIKGGA